MEHRKMSAGAEKNREMYLAMLKTAVEEARIGLGEGGIPIGAALFERNGKLSGRGHNRRVQQGDPSAHGETDAFRMAGRKRNRCHRPSIRGVRSNAREIHCRPS